MSDKNASCELSVVVPVFNEEDNIAPMIAALEEALSSVAFEVIFVDDGSRDHTVERILSFKNAPIKLISFARNFGQTSAMAAGIECAEGEFIVTIDGDLQNDPKDILRMLDRLKQDDLDMVVGNRKNRKDSMFLRKVPSKIANKLIRRVSHVYVKDYGCTLKVFRASIAKELDLYGELHRFIPILASITGAKIGEMDVLHHPRKFGQSKYGLGRTLRVASDLLLMGFFIRYRQKPMHLFGGLGLILTLIGGLIEVYLLILKILGEDIGDRPLFFVGIFLLLTGIQLITTGFIAELQMRTYFRATDRRPYVIAKRYEHGELKRGE